MVNDIRRFLIALSLVGLGSLLVASACAVLSLWILLAIPIPESVKLSIGLLWALAALAFFWAKFMNWMLNAKVEPAALTLAIYIVTLEFSYKLLVELELFEAHNAWEHLVILLGLATVATCCTMRPDSRYWED